jgi:beta-lactam-binding protein with PASTA domain
MSFAKIVPMAESMSCKSGEVRESGFDVINTTQGVIRVGVEALGDAKAWVKIAPGQVELSLPARGQEKLKVSVTPPASAAGTQASFTLRVYRMDDPADAIESPAVGVEVAAVPGAAPVTKTTPAARPPWGLILGVAAGVLLLVGGGVVGYLLIPSKVPELVGKTRDEALAALSDAKLTPNVTEELTGTAESGRVIRQSPAAGERVPEDKIVSAVVELQSVEVPQLIGLNTRSASDALLAAGLAIGTTAHERTGNSPGGAVIQQSPAAGGRAIPGTPVDVTVETELVRVPDLKGLTLDRASARLGEDGLRIQPRAQIEAGAAPGTVVAQAPAPGTEVDASAVVQVDLQTARVTTPAVVSFALADAARTIRAANLVLAPVVSDFQLQPPFGVVTAQDPPPGTAVPPGTRVTLRVRTQAVIREPLPVVLRQGTLSIRQTFTADLDSGTTGAGDGSDLWFRAETATVRFLEPRGGATLASMGTREPGVRGCKAASLGVARIPIDNLRPGTFVCVKTTQGAFAQLRILKAAGPSPGTLEVGYVVWR